MYAIYGNMDPINIPQMLAYIYIAYMDPMGIYIYIYECYKMLRYATCYHDCCSGELLSKSLG